mgnify:CR=1 FL=1
MIWKRSRPQRETTVAGSLLSCYLGELQRACDPTHMVAVMLGGELMARTALNEIGDPMIGCSLEHAGIAIEIFDYRTVSACFSVIA